MQGFDSGSCLVCCEGSPFLTESTIAPLCQFLFISLPFCWCFSRNCMSCLQSRLGYSWYKDTISDKAQLQIKSHCILLSYGQALLSIYCPFKNIQALAPQSSLTTAIRSLPLLSSQDEVGTVNKSMEFYRSNFSSTTCMWRVLHSCCHSI